MSEDRIIDLEVKISHQEIAIETLQQLAYEQHKIIEGLEGKIARLSNKLENFIEGGAEIGPANEKPPHY